jgi:hypothetical protein
METVVILFHNAQNPSTGNDSLNSDYQPRNQLTMLIIIYEIKCMPGIKSLLGMNMFLQTRLWRPSHVRTSITITSAVAQRVKKRPYGGLKIAVPSPDYLSVTFKRERLRDKTSGQESKDDH